MRNKIIAIISLALALPMVASAKPRSKADMLQAASGVLSIGESSSRLMASSMAEQLGVLSENDALTVIGYKDGGYAIVTNDDLLPEVIGYSSSQFSKDCDNENFNWWWRMMEDAVRTVVAKGVAYKAVAPDASRFPAEVPQMMTTSWGQMEPFNNMCPLEYSKTGEVVGRSVVGCVATALTQIMNYHQYPTQGTGKYTDMQTTDAWGQPVPITVDFADYTYDYSLLQDTYTPGNYSEREAEEVAKLSYTVGVSFAMIYGAGASGTFLDSAAVSLKKHLGFRNVKYQSRGYTDETSWMNTIFDELSHNRPVAYGGADDIFTIGGGGHCFVFDGYDSRGLVHVNWGWYGRNDGYYDVNLLNPRIHNFKNQQDMIYGLEPPVAQNPETTVVTLSGNISLSDIDDIVETSKIAGIRTADLSEAELADGMIPERAFYGSKLTSIRLPKNTVGIGNGAFANCRDLVSVEFPEANAQQEFIVEDNVIYSADGTRVIEVMPYYYNNKQVMADYTSLLTFRDGVKEISPDAMNGCFRIHGVIIPPTVEKIGKNAFARASGLKRVTSMTSTPATAVVGAFNGIDAGFTSLVIPAGTWEVYSRCGEWRKFFALDYVTEIGTNVRARSVVRTVGEKNPELRYQVFGGYVFGEPVLTCEADETSPAGEYPIVVGMGSLVGDDIVLTNGVLRVVETGEPDGISEINVEANSNPSYYNVLGQPVGPQAKGLVIVNGKAMIK